MGDQQTVTTPTPTANAAGTVPGSQPTGKQNRGRGGRFNSSRRGNQATRAKADINPAGAPVELGKKFLGFHSLKRGNAQVTINHGFTETVLSDYKKTIVTNQESKGFFDNNGLPLDLKDLTNGLGAGLCLSSAIKLLDATPDSSIQKVATFRSLRDSKLYVPRTFIQILDLIGKSDYQDWVIRIKHNADLIQRLLLKALKYFLQIQDFIDQESTLDKDELDKFKTLNNVAYRNFDNIFFPTTDSVSSIHQAAIDWLRVKVKNNFELEIKDVGSVFVSYPQLPSDLPTREEVITWLGLLRNGVHPDYEKVISAGVLTLVNLNWLENPEKTLSELDNDTFGSSPVKDLTVLTLLRNCGLLHVNMFLKKKHFIQLSRSAISYYQETISQRLGTIFSMLNQGTSTFGNPAQLVFVPRDMANNIVKIGGDIDFLDLDKMANHCISYVKLDVADKITKSAMIGLVKDVELDPDYVGHFTSSLKTIAGSFFTKDGMFYSQSKQYG